MTNFLSGDPIERPHVHPTSPLTDDLALALVLAEGA